MDEIERKAGIKFKKIGIPQMNDVIEATSKEILINLESVKQEVIPLFKSTAK